MSDLEDLLKALARAESRVETPARVEAAVMAAWDASQRGSRESTSRRFRIPRPRAGKLLPAAAALLLAAALGRHTAATLRPALPTLPPAPDREERASAGSVARRVPPAEHARPPAAGSSTMQTAALVQPVDDAPPRTLVVVGAPLMPGEPVRVVRMRVAAATLASLGVQNRAGAIGSVDLEVLVGEDGVARAVRVGM